MGDFDLLKVQSDAQNMTTDQLQSEWSNSYYYGYVYQGSGPEPDGTGIEELARMIADRPGDNITSLEDKEWREDVAKSAGSARQYESAFRAELKRRGISADFDERTNTPSFSPITDGGAPSADPHLDTGHYDDGHSLGWKEPDAPSADPHLDTGHYDDGHSFGWSQATPPNDPDDEAAWNAFYQTQGLAEMKDGPLSPDRLTAQDELDGTMRNMTPRALKVYQRLLLLYPNGVHEEHNLTPPQAFAALASRPPGADDGKPVDPSKLDQTRKLTYDRAQQLINDATIDPHLDTGHYDDGHSFGWKQQVSRVPGGIATLGGAAALVLAFGGFALARGGTPPAATQRPAAAITASATPKTAAPTNAATNAPTQPTGPSGATAASQGYKCQGGQTKLFDNWNTGVVDSGGGPVSFSTNGKTYCLVTLATYHWNNGSGAVPGTIQLVGSSGTVSGHAVGTNGQDNVPDANWVVSYTAGNEPLLSGTYQCKDSDPATWAQNDASQHLGFCRVWVTEAVK